MKKTVLLTSIIILFQFNPLVAQDISFNDSNFKQSLISAGYDLNNDSQIDQNEAVLVDSINFYNTAIVNLVGIEYFTNLEVLIINNPGWGGITEEDFSPLQKLRKLDLSYNKLTALNVSMLPNLQELDCTNNTSLNTICVADAQVANDSPLFKKDFEDSWNDQCGITSTKSDFKSDEQEIQNIYNLLGQQISPNESFNQIIIIEYRNGKREKAYHLR